MQTCFKKQTVWTKSWIEDRNWQQKHDKIFSFSICLIMSSHSLFLLPLPFTSQPFLSFSFVSFFPCLLFSTQFSPLASFHFSPPSLPLFSHFSFLLVLLSSSFLLPPIFLSILLIPLIIPLQLKHIVSNSLKSKYQWLLSWMIHSEPVHVHPCKSRINVWILACDQGSSRKIIM